MYKNFILSPPNVSVLYTGIEPVLQLFKVELVHSSISMHPVKGFPVSPV
jgi:hypothetical protein